MAAASVSSVRVAPPATLVGLVGGVSPNAVGLSALVAVAVAESSACAVTGLAMVECETKMHPSETQTLEELEPDLTRLRYHPSGINFSPSVPGSRKADQDFDDDVRTSAILSGESVHLTLCFFEQLKGCIIMVDAGVTMEESCNADPSINR